MFDAGSINGIDAAHIALAIGRVPADTRAGGEQQPQFCAHQIAASHQQYRTGLQIEKYRQEAHAILRSPALRGCLELFSIYLLRKRHQEKFISSLWQSR